MQDTDVSPSTPEQSPAPLPTAPPSSSNKTLIIVIVAIVAVILLCCCLGAAGVLLFRTYSTVSSSPW